MSSEQLSRTPPRSADDACAAGRSVEEALCALYRSIGTHQFYPSGHPVRTETLREGYKAWRSAEAEPRWSASGVRVRAGGLWCGRDHVGGSNPAVLGLARLFSTHGLAAVSLREPLRFEGFARLVALLADNPENLASRGGIVEAWRTSPFAHCLELAAFAVSLPGEERRDGRAYAAPSETEATSPLSEEIRRPWGVDERLLGLFARLDRPGEMTAFLAALQELATAARGLVSAERYEEAFRVAALLKRRGRAMEADGRFGEREYLFETIRLLVRGGFLGWLVERIATGDEKEARGLLLEAGRTAVVPLVNALIAERRRAGRRRLVETLIAVGEPVVPVALRMLEDQRWYVVRNMLTILGGIGSGEAVKALARLLADPEPRIRRELARTLARLPGSDADRLLVELLGDAEPAVRLTAVDAAAGRRSAQMLEALWSTYESSPDWAVKAAVLRAVGRTGMPEAAERLEAVARARPLLHRRRWEGVRLAALEALAALGGEAAAAALERLSARRRAPAAGTTDRRSPSP